MSIGKLSAALAAVCAFLLAPPLARAEEEAWQGKMEERMRALEDQLAASQATIEAQRKVLETSGTPHVSAEGSGLDAFFNGLEWGGHATASYQYNLNNPDVNAAANPYYQFNTDHNTFSLDAVKLELGKPAAEPGTAGFRFEALYGENANILNAGVPSIGRAAGARNPADEDLFIQEAYAAYNYEGIELNFGKFETLLGYEVIDSPYNPNITHGFLFTLGIPLVHTGLLAKGTIPNNEEFSWAAGVVNGFNNDSDYGDNKGVLGRLGWAEGNASVTLNTFIGAEQTRTKLSTGQVIGDNHDRMQIYDLIGTLDVDEKTKTWVNVDIGREEFSRDLPSGVATATEDAQWFGVAAGVKRQLSEKLSLAVRGEWFRDDGGTRTVGCTLLPAGTGVAGQLGGAGFTPAAPPCGGNGEEIDLYSATATLAYKLTESLMARLEFRHDLFDGRGPEDANGQDFPKHGAGFDDQHDTAIFEVSYLFE